MHGKTKHLFFFVMSGSKEKKSGLSESFIIGVIAIVFLMIGYQTALFIHHAAVTKIAAHRDDPDTVYIYTTSADQSDCLIKYDTLSDEKNVTSIVRKNSGHSPRAEAVRRNYTRKKVDSFRFDPNTVSVEDLCLLGFSLKQAKAIDNYRAKGGRFSRKEDFAKSYVVSDSLFKRLEAYIYIPLVDLNTADSADFDALPGVGGWFASRMLEYRKKLGSYSYKEQLMDIYRFDQEKYDALSDLITVSPEHVVPYPLWILPADSLQEHPYIRNYETAKAIVLYRENNSSDKWTVSALREAGVLTEDAFEKLSGCYISDSIPH